MPKMSETNAKGEGFVNFFKQLFTKKEKSPVKRSSKIFDDKSEFQLSNPNPPKRKIKKMAPQPSVELTSIQKSNIYEPSRSQQNYTTSVNDIEKGFSKLTLSDHHSNSKQVSLAQVDIESDSTDSKGKKIKNTKSSKMKKGSNPVVEIKSIIFNSNGNQNAIENYQVQKCSENEDIGSAKAESDQAVSNLQTNFKNNKPSFEIKSPNDEQTDIIAGNNSSQILENEAHQIETTRCNIRNEDEASRSNQNECDIASEKIESVMQEVENFKLEIKKLNNSESFLAIEMGLTNAIIKLDGIQMPKNELLKKKRKEGIILIQEMFKQLDEQGKKDQT